jgi:hypothetical protein
MTTLLVPLPVLKLEASGPALATLEKPITVTSKLIVLPDGTPITDQTPKAVAGFFLYRQPPSSVATQIWDQDQKQWRNASDSLAATLKPKPLAFKKGQPAPWEGVFVATTDKDAVQAGAMAYFFRTFFQAPFSNSMLSGFSPPTAPIRFVALADAAQAGIKLESPETAIEIQLFLRNSAKQIIGSVHLINVSGQARIEISNTVGATVVLTEQGDIQLTPAAGRNVVLGGALLAQRIHYQPEGGGGTQWLKAT